MMLLATRPEMMACIIGTSARGRVAGMITAMNTMPATMGSTTPGLGAGAFHGQDEPGQQPDAEDIGQLRHQEGGGVHQGAPRFVGFQAPGYHRAGALRQMDVTKVGLSGAGRECWHGRMRLALLSDIHANLPALEACLAAAQALGAERLVFLGDFVGYGPDPEAVVRRVQPLIAAGAVILGNHDAATFQSDGSMNSMAAAAIAWTRQQLVAGTPSTSSNRFRWR